MKKIVLASGNQGKVREINQILADLDIEVVAQTEFNVPEADETGLTFVENAILKARNACRHTGLPAIADDSGLEVDALKGEPGIYSARYAGPGNDDDANNRKLLQSLKGVEDADRTARFQCLMVFMEHDLDPTPLICQGTWEGSITHEPSGDNGFGYDPLFYVADKGCTSAELSAEEKNKLSHRGQALRCLMETLHKQPPR